MGERRDVEGQLYDVQEAYMEAAAARANALPAEECARLEVRHGELARVLCLPGRETRTVLPRE